MGTLRIGRLDDDGEPTGEWDEIESGPVTITGAECPAVSGPVIPLTEPAEVSLEFNLPYLDYSVERLGGFYVEEWHEAGRWVGRRVCRPDGAVAATQARDTVVWLLMEATSWL